MRPLQLKVEVFVRANYVHVCPQCWLHYGHVFVHPTVTNYIQLPLSPFQQRVHLIMELCEGGELFERISKRKTYPEAEAAEVCHTLVSAVAHFQAHGLMHRDLKPENVLLVSPTSNTKVKVADYGLAAFVRPGEQPVIAG